MVAKNVTPQTLSSKYPRNKQDNRNKHTFTNSEPTGEVGEFLGGSFVLPGDKILKNSIEEARPKLKSTNTLVIRDFKDGYFVERNRVPSPEVSIKNITVKESKKIETTPVLLTPAHLRSQSLPQTFIPEKKSQKTRKVQDFILMTSQNIVVPKSGNNSNHNLEYGCSPPHSPEKWAGGAYTNSPPPKHLPCPKF